MSHGEFKTVAMPALVDFIRGTTMIYVGKRSETGCIVRVIDEKDPQAENPDVDLFSELLGEALPPRNDLRNHSPDGFEWGYRGSGPTQLALALLLHATGDEELSLRLYQRFRDAATSKLKNDTWMLSKSKILHWVHNADGIVDPPAPTQEDLSPDVIKNPEPTSFSVNYTGTA